MSMWPLSSTLVTVVDNRLYIVLRRLFDCGMNISSYEYVPRQIEDLAVKLGLRTQYRLQRPDNWQPQLRIFGAGQRSFG
jgi:hypothetical protein